MKITLIKPNIGRRGHSLYVDESRMEPLQLGILAALTPSDIEVVMYDDRAEVIPYDEKTDLVCITVETFTARRAYEISRQFMDMGIKVLMGGMHVMLLPGEVKEHATSIMIGDAEDKWLEMTEDLRNGCLKEEYVCSEVIVPQKGIITRRDIFKGKNYLPITLLQFSRGCRNSCSFCASGAYFRHHHYCTAFNHLLAFPGTETYERFLEEGRLFHESWWLEKGYTFGTISFMPKLVSDFELKNLCRKYKKKYYTFFSILKRGITLLRRTRKPLINMVYWYQNILFHFEVDKRFGIPIGENMDEVIDEVINDK